MQKQRGGTIACKNLSIHNNEVIKVILMVDFIERYTQNDDSPFKRNN